MKATKIINLVVSVIILVTTSSFKTKRPSIKLMTGTYGICNCGKESDIKLELTFNEDNTFHYFDNNNSKHIIDIKGNWTSKGNTIFLEYKSEDSIHNKWLIVKNEKCLKSKKGV